MTPPPDLAGILIEDLLGRGLRVRIPVTGASMGRALRCGDVVTLAPPGDALARGDLVMFRDPAGALMLHRILRVWKRAPQGARYQTRGDANLRLDAIVDAARIRGRVVCVERKGGHVEHLDNASARWRALALALAQLMVSGLAYKLARVARSFRSGGVRRLTTDR